MEGLDALVVDVDEVEVVELLQHEVRRVVVDAAARVIADALEEHLEGRAVEDVLAGVDLVADIAPTSSKASRIGFQRFASSSKAASIRPGGRCGQG